MVRQYRYITFQDRKQISTRYLNGDRVADIADGLGVTAATVYRELKRGETGGLDRNQRRAYIVILHYYRDADKAIKMNERVIKNLEDQYYSTLGAVNSDGMPHGKGTTSNPVERVVLNIPGSVTRTIDRLRRENEETECVKAEIAEELKCLNYTEKALVLGFYINGEQWERLSARVNYSPRQCRNIRAVALDRLAKRFAVNKTISRYRFPEK